MNQMILHIGIHLAKDYYVAIRIGGFLKCIIENTVIFSQSFNVVLTQVRSICFGNCVRHD